MYKSLIIFLGLLVILLPIGTSLKISNASGIADIYKGDRKQVSVSSLKCNNINVNVNGLELNVLPQFLGGEVAADALEPNTDVNSFAADNNGYGSQINDFRFICINNNNNTIISTGNDTITPDPCEECFINNLNDTQLQNFKESLGNSGFTIESFCEFLSNPEISNDGKTNVLLQISIDAGVIGDDLLPLIECLEASTIFDFANRGG